MTTTLSIDGADLESLGCIIVRFDGDLAPALERPPSIAVPGQFGEIRSGAEPTVAPRSVSVQVEILGDTPAEIASIRDAVIARAAGITSGTADGVATGAVPLVFGSDPTRQYIAHLSNSPNAERDAGALAGGLSAARMTLVFTALDPRAYDVDETTKVLSNATVRCPVGDAGATKPVLTLTGPFAARIVTLVDGANATQGTFTITGAVGGGESVVIDCDEETVVHVVGGVPTPENDWMTDGDFFELERADVIAGVAPGVKLDAGAGSITYRRAWP